MNREQLSHNQDGMFVEHGEERRGEKERRREGEKERRREGEMERRRDE